VVTSTPSGTAFSKREHFSQKAAFYCALGSIFFTPISPALMNISLFLTLVFVLLSGQLKNHWETTWENPVAKGAILLFLLYAAGTIWSIVPMDEALKGLKKYNELWYIALLMPLFNTEKRKNIGVSIFLSSMGLILAIVYVLYFELTQEARFQVNENHALAITVDGGFRTHIITNILMSFFVFITAHRMIMRRRVEKISYGILFLLSINYALFISTGTTGQILTIALFSLLLLQHFGKKGFLLIPITIALFIGTGYLNKQSSVHHAINKIQKGMETSHSSAGQRLEYLKNSIYLIQEKPWIGAGTGSIEQRYAQIPKNRIETHLTSNPHNEYAATGLQLGITGIIGLLSLFLLMVYYSFQITSLENRFLAQGIITLMAVGSLGNSLLMDSGEGYFWCFFTALLFAPLNAKLAK